jgi:hypothetical protein
MSPIILAAKVIPDSLKAEDLLPIHMEILHGVIGRGIKICSCSADGTETERKLQRLMAQEADSMMEYRYPHPGNPGTFMLHTIPVFNKQPVIFLQDSHHALKTA